MLLGPFQFLFSLHIQDWWNILGQKTLMTARSTGVKTLSWSCQRLQKPAFADSGHWFRKPKSWRPWWQSSWQALLLLVPLSFCSGFFIIQSIKADNLEIFSFLCATRLSYQQVMFMVVTSVGLILKYCEQVGSLGIFLVCQVTQCC